MKHDNIQIQLYSECWIQSWARKQISKPIEKVTKINYESIASVKQRRQATK
jgi:hypothetical protein